MPTINLPVRVPLDQVSTWINRGDPTEFGTSISNHGTQTFSTDVIARNRNDNWKDKVKAGVDASTYYKRTITNVTIQPLLVETRSISTGSYPYHTKGYFCWAAPGLHPAYVNSDSTTRDQALARVKRRIASLEESYRALIPLAELREARGLIRQMTEFTLDMVKAIAQLKRTKGKSLFRFVQDRWLIYSFGISPMMADLQGLGNSLWAYLTKGDVRDRVQGTAGKDWLSSTKGDSVAGTIAAPVRYGAEARHVLTYRYVAGWKFLIRSSNDYTAANHFGVSPPALIPALWETTAFSWVADYFSTIGDWLDDVFVGSAGNAMYVVECRKYQYRSVMTLEHYLTSQSYFLQHRRGQVVVEYTEFERTPMPSLPSRVLRFKTLDEIGLHSVTKLLNLVSLIGRGKYW